MNIGLTGKLAAGKGEIAKILESSGFSYHSLSDVIREELKKEGIEASRENMIRKGNELREKYGASVLAIKIKELFKDDDNIIDSVRNPFEVNELRKLENFHLLGVDAPVELRFKRLKARARKGDVMTLDEMKKAEILENKNIDTNQQLDKTLAMADKIIINNSSIESLKAKVLKEIENWRNK